MTYETCHIFLLFVFNLGLNIDKFGDISSGGGRKKILGWANCKKKKILTGLIT
jgi:hypothetical protein